MLDETSDIPRDWKKNMIDLSKRKKLETVCRGKVANLEYHVPEQWWKTVFSDDVYLKTDGDVVEDPEITKEEVNEIILTIPQVKEMLQRSNTNILDLCCGQGRHTLQLVQDYPVRVYGHDQSSYLISLAQVLLIHQERAKAQNLEKQTTFTVGDCRVIPYDDEYFDLVLLLGNSFGYFSSDDQDIVVLNEIKRVLKPGGRVIIDLTDGTYMRNNFSERSWEWIDDTTFVLRERQLSADQSRLISREIVTITNQGVIRDQFYQERLYSREDLYKVVQNVGFQTTEKPNVSLNAKSKRNEDLGMMEHRMIITCTKEGAETFSHLESSATLQVEECQKPHITVLLGDASQPSVGKLNNQWNQEDLETRKKLLDALKSKGFSFTPLSNHQHLLTELVQNKPQFVLNLCDEGWNNDALKELHVAALLEVLDIPYSGAGPNCLAFCYDKGMVNKSAQAIDIDTPFEVTYVGEGFDVLKEKMEQLSYPAFVKPIKGDNSLGITTRSIVHSFSQLVEYIKDLEQQGLGHVLVQEYLEGDEYGVGMIGNPKSGFHFLPIIKVNFSKIIDQNLPPILGYESKWDPSSPYWTGISFEVADLPHNVEIQLKQSCIKLWDRFSCQDYCRFDFRASKDGTLKLLEVNPNPGWCWDGKLAHMCRLEGKSYEDMVEMILEASWKRLGMLG